MDILSRKIHCSICLCDIEKNERKSKLVCNHTYHASCITSWREKNISCPMCRQVIALSCAEKCNVCLNLPSSRCALELLRVFLFPLIVLIIILSVVLKAERTKE